MNKGHSSLVELLRTGRKLDRGAVDRDPTAVGLVVPGKNFGQGGLPAPVMADDRVHLAWIDPEGHIVERLRGHECLRELPDIESGRDAPDAGSLAGFVVLRHRPLLRVPSAPRATRLRRRPLVHFAPHDFSNAASQLPPPYQLGLFSACWFSVSDPTFDWVKIRIGMS